MNATHDVNSGAAARRRASRRLVRWALVLSAPLALLDLQCSTDFRDAFVGGAYDFVTAKTFEGLEQLFAAFLGGGEEA